MKEWLRLINAETEGDLMDIQKETKIPEVHQTIVKLRELSADDKLRQEVYYREKRLHDEASALNNARREGIELGRVEGIELGRAEQMDAIYKYWTYIEKSLRQQLLIAVHFAVHRLLVHGLPQRSRFDAFFIQSHP